MRRSLFDQRRYLFRPGDINRMASAGDFDLVAVGPRSVPSFEVRIDGPICTRYEHPAWLASPRRCSDDRLEIVSRVKHLRSRHKGCPLRRKVSSKVLVKLSGIQISEAVRRLLYRGGLAEVGGKALSIISLVFVVVWHVGCDVHQTNNNGIVPGFRDYRSPIAMSYKNTRTVLLSQDASCRGYIFFKRRLRLLYDADVIAVLDKNVVDAFPPRSVGPGAVNEHNVLHGCVLSLDRCYVQRSKQCEGNTWFESATNHKTAPSNIGYRSGDRFHSPNACAITKCVLVDIRRVIDYHSLGPFRLPSIRWHTSHHSPSSFLAPLISTKESA